MPGPAADFIDARNDNTPAALHVPRNTVTLLTVSDVQLLYSLVPPNIPPFCIPTAFSRAFAEGGWLCCDLGLRSRSRAFLSSPTTPLVAPSIIRRLSNDVLQLG